MKKSLILIFTANLFVTLLLMGCGEKETTSEPEDGAAESSEQSKPVQEKRYNPIQGQVDALNKAKDVEATLKEAEEKRRKELEKQENGG